MKRPEILEEQKVRMIKEGLVKKVSALLLAGTMSIMTFSGCVNSSGQNVIDPHEKNPVISDTITEPQETTVRPNSPFETETTTQPVGKDPIEETPKTDYMKIWNDWLAQISQNNMVLNIDGIGKYTMTSDIVKFEKQNSSEVYYYVFENGVASEQYYSADGSTFKKVECQYENCSQIFAGAMNLAEVKNFDESSQTFTISFDENNYQININENFTASISGDFSANVTLVGNVENIQLPEIQSAPIYTIDENGNWIFDCGLIGQVCEDWLKGDNQFGEDADVYMCKALGASIITSIQKVLWVEASKEEFKLYVLADTEGNKRIEYHNFNTPRKGQDFYKMLNAGEIKTAEDLKTFLWNNTHLATNVAVWIDNIEYTSLDDDYATKEHYAGAGTRQEKFESMFGKMTEKEVFDALTAQVFKRIETKGTQSQSCDIYDPNSIMTGFSDSKILFSFKPTTGYGLGWDLGTQGGCALGYLLVRNGQLQLVSFDFHSSTYTNASQGVYLTNILKNDEHNNYSRNWVLSDVNVTVIDNSCLSLWNNYEKEEQKLHTTSLKEDALANEEKKYLENIKEV